jgi:hypothetical protein
VDLVAGFNLVGYPGPTVPAAAKLAWLASESGASFVVGLTTDSTGPTRFRLWLPETGLDPSLRMEAGRAYLLRLPASRLVVIPAQ